MRKLRIGYLSLLVFLAFRTFPVFSIDLAVSLYHEHLFHSILFTTVEGYYRVSGDGQELGICQPGASWYMIRRKDSLYIRDHHGEWFRMKEVLIAAGEESSVFSLKPANPVLDTREYLGELRIGVSMNSLQVLNIIDLEKYVMGVAETEAGPGCSLEYYKVQSILCRTFALKNLERHLEEGFHLCDGVHCQAYKGRNIWNDDVETGAEVTGELVICDADSVLINTAYHSNSGGETRGAGKVWLKEESYLRPVLDPFSLGQRNASWEKSMFVRDWIYYLLSYGIHFPEDADTSGLEMRLKHRQEFYRVFGDSLAFFRIREDFTLRSDFFDVLVEGDRIRMKGRGYGHGVGLSQEGAMEMARRRYHYTAILNFYYHGILIIPYFDIKPLFSH